MSEGIKIVVVFDNERYVEGLQTGWGFSAVVEALGEKVLFDTGPDGSKLLANMDRLGIEPGSISTVVFSLMHADVGVYVPGCFS